MEGEMLMLLDFGGFSEKKEATYIEETGEEVEHSVVE